MAYDNFLRWILAGGLIFAGAYHFLNPQFYEKIMPPYLPYQQFLIYLSGALEIVFGVLLLSSKFRVFAAWGIVFLLIAVFPANIHMALNAERYPDIHPVLLYLRLPLQFVLIAWAYRFTGKNSGKNENTL